MNSIKIALLQLLPTRDIHENLRIGINACKKAKALNADIALFPEMYSVGYSIPEDISELKESAISSQSVFVHTFSALAKEYDMAVGITFLESNQPLPKNSFILFDRFGNTVFHYSKVHTCDFGDEKRLSPGDDFFVSDLDTASGVVKVGGMICYDREFPESARILMLKGAEIILVPNACPMEINRLAQLRARAYENMAVFATCNYPAPHPDCNGHSSVFDGVAYLPELDGSRDTCLLEAGEDEGIYVAEVDLDMLRAYRENEVHGNAYRRPEKYGLLLSRNVEYPFIRTDKRGD